MRGINMVMAVIMASMVLSANLYAADKAAGNKGSGVKDDFVVLDTDKDNRISRDEWKGSDDEFNRRDLDRSGSLSRYEFYQNLMPGNLN